MSQVVSNDVSAIQPEIWSAMVQVPLYKSLVALEVANMRFSDTLTRNGDTIKLFVWRLFQPMTKLMGRV